MEIRFIQTHSAEYDQMLILRNMVLRKPLGMDLFVEDLSRENSDWLVGSFEDGSMTGCCILTNEGETIRLRQMAVHPALQGKGIGRSIIEFAEDFGRQQGFKKLSMHARDSAIGFYTHCGYTILGEGFSEIGLPHHLMIKYLQK